jgi:phage/plasmid-associated DNA primase
MFTGFKLGVIKSIYNNKTVLNEYIPNNRLNSLIQHNIGVAFNVDDYQRKTNGFMNELECFTRLASKYNTREKCFKIHLVNSKYVWGRVQVVDHSSLSVIHRPTRHSLCQDQYIDIDIKSCCQSIFLNLVRLNGVIDQYPKLVKYVENRDEILLKYMTMYSVDKHCIKQLFTGIGFGGSYKSWFQTNGIEFNNDEFIIELNNEYYKLADIIYEANKNICEDMIKSCPTKFAAYSDKSMLLAKKKRTTMAMVYQTAERYCQEAAISWLCTERGFNMKDIVPCQDGFMILAHLYYSELCNDCNLVVANLFQMELQFVCKDFDERFEIPEYITKEQQRAIEKSQRDSDKLAEKSARLAEKSQRDADKLAEKSRNIFEMARRKHKRDFEHEGATQLKADLKIKEKEYKKTEIENEAQKRIDDLIEDYCIDGKITLPSGKLVDENKHQELFNGVMNDEEAAAKLFELYPHWVTCEEILYVFDFTTGMYSSTQNSYNTVINKHSDFLHLMLKDDGFDKKWYRSENRSYGNTSELLFKIITFLKTKNVNNDWLRQNQSSSLDKVLFTNGIYNFNTHQFHEKFNPAYVFFGRIHHAVEEYSNEDIEYMEDIKQRLFYNALGIDIGDYLIENIGRGLSGECMKRILFAIGDTNCGKGVVTTACQLSLGDYCGSFNAESIAHRETSQDEAQIMRWVMLLRNKRIIISNEMKSGMKLNGNFIKKICSGGDALTGRGHCQNEVSFQTHFLPIVLDNDMNQITPYDTAVDDRVRCLTFQKSYVSEPKTDSELLADPNIKKELETTRFQRCFIAILLRSHADFVDRGRVELNPDGVKNAKRELIETTMDKNPVTTFLRDYQITDNANDFVASSTIDAWIKELDLNISMTKFGRELKKYAEKQRFSNVHSKDKKVFGKTIKVWMGIKSSNDEFEEDFNERT